MRSTHQEYKKNSYTKMAAITIDFRQLPEGIFEHNAENETLVHPYKSCARLFCLACCHSYCILKNNFKVSQISGTGFLADTSQMWTF